MPRGIRHLCKKCQHQTSDHVQTKRTKDGDHGYCMMPDCTCPKFEPGEIKSNTSHSWSLEGLPEPLPTIEYTRLDGVDAVLKDWDQAVIINTYKKSASPWEIAKFYNAPLFVIADVLGLPHDEKEIERIHKDKNFYDHGFGPENINRRCEHYAIILHDGEFEKWQPFCYMDPACIDWQYHKAEAAAIPKQEDPILEWRRLWIVARFMEYQGEEWTKNEAETLAIQFKIGFKNKDGTIPEEFFKLPIAQYWNRKELNFQASRN